MLSSSHGKSLGMAACTAIVVGNMVGSGFYLSPAAVAPYGNLAILIWLIMGGGAICLGLTFASCAACARDRRTLCLHPARLRRLPGFLIAWGYWISIWASLPVIAVAFAGVVVDLFPAIRSRGVVVLITLGRHLGSCPDQPARRKHGGSLMAEVTTYAKFAIRRGRAARVVVHRSHPTSATLIRAASHCCRPPPRSPPLTMFAFSGSNGQLFRPAMFATPNGRYPARPCSAFQSRPRFTFSGRSL